SCSRARRSNHSLPTDRSFDAASLPARMRRARRLFLTPDRVVRVATSRECLLDLPPLRSLLIPRHERFALTQGCLIPKSPIRNPQVCRARYLFFLPALQCSRGSSECPPVRVCPVRVLVASSGRV